MEVFELWKFNSFMSASKGQGIKIELKRVRIIEVRIMEVLLYTLKVYIFYRLTAHKISNPYSGFKSEKQLQKQKPHRELVTSSHPRDNIIYYKLRKIESTN